MSANEIDMETVEDRAERWDQLRQLESWLEKPMIALSVIWLFLLILELTRGLSGLLTAIGTAIWIAFIIDFFVRLLLAPDKHAYLRRNWLTALSLVVPAFRIFRIASIAGRVGATASRSFRLVKVVGTMNRSMRALASTLGRRGFAYVMLLTIAVLLAGSSGMYAFEHTSAGATRGFATFIDSLWWTAMLLTTMGSASWPESPEGRALCLLLSLYAFAVFGYVTATIATYFIGRDAENDEGEIAGAEDLRAIREELRALRAELRENRALPPATGSR